MVVKSVLIFENTAELKNGNGRCKAKTISISQGLTSRLRSLVYTVTSVLDNRSGTSVQVQVHWYVRLKAERITTSAEQILSLIFTEHFFSKFTKFTLLKKCSARIVSSNLFCSVRCSAAAILSPGCSPMPHWKSKWMHLVRSSARSLHRIYWL